jgi:glycosyltransferase involved in cell wall biosynthesis
LRDIEIICVDDGSTDASADILREYAAKDKRFMIITQTNAGAGAARNVGMDKAVGEYLYFLDSDDFLELNAMEIAYNEAENYAADIVIFSFECLNAETGKISNWYHFISKLKNDFKGDVFSYKDFPDHVLEFGRMAWNKLFRYSFIKEHRLQFQNTSKYNDVYFTSMSLIFAKRIRNVDVILYHYFFLSNNSISLKLKQKSTPLEVFYDLKMALLKAGVYDVIEKSYINFAVQDLISGVLRSEVDFELEYQNLRRELRALELDSLKKEDFVNESLYESYKKFIDSENVQEYAKNYVFLLHRQLSDAYDLISGYDKWCNDLKALHIKNNLIIDWLNSLLIVKQQGKSIEQYFTRRGYFNIAIYGYGKIGQRLVDELVNGAVSVKYIIDRADIDTAYTVYKPTDGLPDVDVIVVTVIYEFDKIQDFLFGKVDCPIVSAVDVLGKLDKSESSIKKTAENPTDFDVLFVTPPIWDVGAPFLAVPQLMGACRENGINSAQIDLSVIAFDEQLKKHGRQSIHYFFTEDFYNNDVAVWKDNPSKNYKEYLKRISFLNTNFIDMDLLRSEYKKGGTLERELINRLTQNIISMMSSPVFYSVYTIQELIDKSPIVPKVVRSCVMNSNITRLIQKSKLVGLSITGISQIAYAIEIAKYVRKVNPVAKIVFGGSAVTLSTKNHKYNTAHLLKYADYLVAGEGETAIVSLSRYILENKGTLSEVPNLIWKNDDSFIRENNVMLEDIQGIPVASFDGLNFDDYLLPEPLLPYHASRGCFYGQCAFCNHDQEYRHNFRVKTAERAVEEILQIVKETGVRQIQFVDEALEPHFFNEIIRAMDSNQEFKDIAWLCYLRVSNYYTEEMVKLAVKNGLKLAMFGVETLIPRLLKFIKKGINADVSKNTLRLFHKNGAKTFAWFMYGLPSETVSEAAQDAEYIKEIVDVIDAFVYGKFMFSVNTDMSREPDQYNIVSFECGNKDEFVSHFDGQIIDLEKVYKAYQSIMNPVKHKTTFTDDRFVVFYAADNSTA